MIKRNKNQIINIFMTILTVINLLLIVSYLNNKKTKIIELKDIAYDVNKKYGYTVYIKEKGEYIPYLVLTSNYNGNALLLRKNLLNDDYSFNANTYGYAGYYKDSSIDKFLNDNFLSILEPRIQSKIIDSEITITAKSSLGKTGTEKENIFRKVFLLSYSEIGFTITSGVLNNEGKPLKYFKTYKDRIAYKNNKAGSWWLRTPNTCYTNVASFIAFNGSLDNVSVDAIIGVRPAFCLKNTEKLKQIKLEGQLMYILDN